MLRWKKSCAFLPLDMWKDYKGAKGSALIELIVVVGICATILFSVSGVISVAIKLTRQAGRRVQAIGYLREGAEALAWLRDSTWSTNIAPLANGVTYFLVYSTAGQTYQTTSTEPIIIDGLFQRQFTVASVKRDASDNIAGSGTTDPNTKQITMQSSWSDGVATSTESLTFYLTNVWQN